MEKTRKPIFGVTFPKARVRVTSDIPITAEEIPVVICLHPGDVQVIERSSEGFVLENTTTKIAPYVALVVPRRLADLAAMPWRDAVVRIATEYREGQFNDTILDLLTKFDARRKPT